MTRAVFVYGSLKPGEKYAHIALDAGHYRCREGFIEGFLLYHLEPEGYPAIVSAPSGGRVHGWLLFYPDMSGALALLDDFEGIHDSPPHYVRRSVDAHPSDPRLPKEAAWVYIYARAERLHQPGAVRVPSGRWTGNTFTCKGHA